MELLAPTIHTSNETRQVMALRRQRQARRPSSSSSTESEDEESSAAAAQEEEEAPVPFLTPFARCRRRRRRYHPVTRWAVIENDDGENSSDNIEEPEEEEGEEAGSTTLLVLARAESRAVVWLRLAVLLFLLSSAAAVAGAVFWYTVDVEEEQFHEAFSGSATRLLDAVGNSLYSTLGAADSHLVDMVSYAAAMTAATAIRNKGDNGAADAALNEHSWPFVTLPNLAVRMAKVRALANVVAVNQFHLVRPAQRAAWENYTQHHDGWVAEGLAAQQHDINYAGQTLNTMPTDEFRASSRISDFNGPVPDRTATPYLPQWQAAPVVTTGRAYNWDLFALYDDHPEYLGEALEKKRVVIAGAINIEGVVDDNNEYHSNSSADTTMPPSAKDYAMDVVDMANEYMGAGDDGEGGSPNEPMSDILYPILDNAVQIETLLGDNEHSVEQGNVVGILVLTVFWRALLKDILPAGMDGVYVIFDSAACSQAFTYRIDGPKVSYTGEGDRHDSKYDHLKFETGFHDLTFSSTTHYTGVPLSENGCPYTLRVYPSEDTEASFRTKSPFIYTAAVVLLSAFTSGFFLAYDALVERRQEIVLAKAVESTASVSLLEEKVKERTQKLQISNERLQQANRRIMENCATSQHEIRTPLNGIIGSLSLLQGTKLDPMQEESMRIISSSSNLLLAVVNDILDFSKLESGNVETEVKKVNLQDVLDSVVYSIETKANEKGVALRTIYDTNVGRYIQTDGRRLQQILFNILSNAIKFSESGSVVELGLSVGAPSICSSNDGRVYSPMDDDDMMFEAGLSDTPTSRPSLLSAQHVFRFTVKDYGKGIAKKDQAKIFQPFRQADAEVEKVHGGTGLGLAIVFKLVQALGGRISVESKEGQWTRFSVELPMHETPANMINQSPRLQGAHMLMVASSTNEQQGKDDVAERMGSLFRQFSISHDSFQDMAELDQRVSAEKVLSAPLDRRPLICLVQEDLYDHKVYERLKQQLNDCPVSLISFGPKHAILGQQPDHHFRSLVRVLPCVLVDQLELVVANKQKRMLALVGVQGCCTVDDESSSCASVLPPALSADDDNGATNSTTKPIMVPYDEFRVLIAEDNSVNQRILSRMLRRLGIKHIDIVDNGKKAVDKEASEPYHIVLMDMQMPVMDGTEACKRIVCRRSAPPSPDYYSNSCNDDQQHPVAKVCFVTAHASTEFEATCLAAGACGFISKPFSLRDIEKCFERLHMLMLQEEKALGSFSTLDTTDTSEQTASCSSEFDPLVIHSNGLMD